jgi:hypothetical protein
MAKETLTIIKADVKTEVTKTVKPKFVKLGNMSFTATVEVDKDMAKELDTDARFVAKLYDDATAEYKKLLSECCLRVDAADKLGSVLPLTDAEVKELDGDLKKIFAKYEKSIEQVAMKHFAKWKSANKERNKYRFKVISGIVLGSAAVETARKACDKLIKDIEAYHFSIKPAEEFEASVIKSLKALKAKDLVWAKWIIWIASLGGSTAVTNIANGGENLLKAASEIENGFNALAKEFG